MRVDSALMVYILGSVGALCIFVIVAFVCWRKSYDIVLRRAAEEWEKLAGAQEKRITALEGEVARQRAENDDLKGLNANLIKLNIELQTELRRARSGEAVVAEPVGPGRRRPRATV